MYNISDTLRGVLHWAILIAVAVWASIAISLFWLLIDQGDLFLYVVVIAWAITTGIAIFYVPMNIRNIRSALKSLNEWDEEYLNSAFITMFEFLPREGPDNPDYIKKDVIARISEIFPYLVEEFNKGRFIVEYDSVINIDGQQHRFDAAVTVGKKKDRMIFVRIFRGENGKTTPDEIKAFFQDVKEVAEKKELAYVFEIVAVSFKGFNDEAMIYALDERNWVSTRFGGKTPVDLIQVMPNNYRVVWTGY
jgi:hypothetical protein